MAWQAKVGRHVSYFKAGGKRRPGTITAVTNPGTGAITIRINPRRGVNETYAGVLPGSNSGQYRPR